MISNQVTGEIMINIDGAVFANNPAMCAYAECRKIIFPHIQRPDAKDMLILSIGTGAGQLSLPDVKKSDNWGVISWAKSAPEIMMDGSVDTVDYQMENLFKTLNDEFNEKNKNPKPEFKSNYKRIDVPAEKRNYSPDISDASNENINALHIAGEETLKDALSKKNNEYTLDEFIELLVKNA